jgi:hypothetical protein
MNPVHDLLGDKVDDLGYTITKRQRDPYDLPKEAIPRGVAYQWNPQPGDLALEPDARRKVTGAKVQDTPVGGWRPVNHERHPGVFGPWGMTGPIEVGGLWLCERPEDANNQAQAKRVAAAHQQVADWAERFGGAGISGGVSIGGVGLEVGSDKRLQDEAFETPAKTLETTVRMPPDMLPHMAEVFAERDRLYANMQLRWDTDGVFEPWQQVILSAYRGMLEDDSSIPQGPTFNALLLPRAIDNVRAKLKEKADE